MLGVKVCELCHPSTRGHRWCCWIASSPKVFLLISLVGRKLHLNLQSGSIHNLFLYVEMLWVVGCCSFFLLNWALGNCKLLNKFQGSNTSKTIIIHNRSFNRLSKRITCAKQMWILTREIIKDRWYLRFSGVNLQRHFLASSQKFDTSTMFGVFFVVFFPSSGQGFVLCWTAYDALLCSDYDDITYPLVLDVRCWHRRPQAGLDLQEHVVWAAVCPCSWCAITKP